MTQPAGVTRSGGSAPALRVAVWQCEPVPRDVASNLARLDAVLAEAAAGGAGLLVTPELTLTGYAVGDLTGLLGPDPRQELGREPEQGSTGGEEQGSIGGEEKASAGGEEKGSAGGEEEGSASGPVAQLSALARRHGVAVVAGVALPGDGCTWNAAVTLDRDGNHLSTYRKAHLFGELDRDRFASGPEAFVLVEIAGIRVATMICYDAEFPEPVRAAALAGAQLVAVPTANMHPYSIVCEAVVPVRAWENQVYVAYANHCGSEGDVHYVGRSVVVGPDGQDVARAGPDDAALLFADIDPAVVSTAQQRNPYLGDRRPELYRSLVHRRRDATAPDHRGLA